MADHRLCRGSECGFEHTMLMVQVSGRTHDAEAEKTMRRAGDLFNDNFINCHALKLVGVTFQLAIASAL